MSQHATTWLAWSLWALSVALVALTGLLAYFTTVFPANHWPLSLTLPLGLAWLAYPTVGALIVTHHPKNPVGWIFFVAGFLWIVPGCATAYADHSIYARPNPLPGEAYAAWLADGDVVLPGLVVVTGLLFLLFPDGRPPSRNWRVVAWGLLVGGTLVTLWTATGPGFLATYSNIENPLGIEGVLRNAVEASGRAGLLLLLVSWVIAALALSLRFEEASPIERQQMKWFGFSLLLVVLSLAQPWYALPVTLALFPFATGLAMLRYRLYDIDVIINRTLVYGSLTASLVLVYLGGVISLQYAFRTLTGQGSQLAIVASTLAIAALFNPLRGCIQAIVDRRFYRSNYDARKTIESFSAKLRDETDLEALNEDLVDVVQETMQPAHVSVWLRPSEMVRSRESPG
jgi:hypothetical protein